MTIRLLALVVVALLVAGVPTSASAVAILDHLNFSDTAGALTPSSPIPGPVTVGSRTSVNVANTYTDPVGRRFTIQTSRAGVNPTVFGDDSTLDQIGFTDALISFTRGIGGSGTGALDPINLSIAYGFDFPLTANSQTYGIQIAGAFRRGFGLATGDRIDVGSFVEYDFVGNEGDPFENQIASARLFSVVTSNTFGPANPPSATEVIACSANIPAGQTCSSFDLLQTVGMIHFERVGDSLKIPNSWLGVRAEDGDAVQAFLDAAAAADAADLAVPEPSTFSLLLGSGLAGLGLLRLRHARRRARGDRRD
jgi:hypothetical protein